MAAFIPATSNDLAAMLADANAARRPVVVRGNGTKLTWRQVHAGAAADISTAGLNRVVAHRHGDLTATIEAGAVLDDVNRELARHGQWIPLDPHRPDRATVGGIVSANDSGPRRHRYGAPRDLIIGIEIARADGVRAKAGGIVVKNVAGYDLARLMTGSFGCLAVILSVTFKLYPVAPSSRTIVIDVPGADVARAIVRALDAHQLTPTAVEIQGMPLRLLVRFESTTTSVEAQTAKTIGLASASGGHAAVFSDADESHVWTDHQALPWSGEGAVVKVTLLPNDLSNIIELTTRINGAANVAIAGRAGLGVLLVGLNGSLDSQIETLRTLRNRRPGTGSATLLRGSNELCAAVGIWGPCGDAFRIMQGLKRAFDPNGILNPGGGPGGV